jgi:cobalt ECF transporter T component CbiQ
MKLTSRKPGGFLERTVAQLLSAMEHSLSAESAAFGRGLLQSLDPRVKVAGLLALIVAAAISAKLWVVGAVFCIAVTLAVLSRLPIAALAARAWIGVLTFTGAIATPAIFLTPGDVGWRVPLFGLRATAQGALSAAFLVLRAEAAATLALLLIFTTPWTHVLKALRIFRVPMAFVAVLGMTCRYIMVLLETAQEMFESRRSRTVGELAPAERRRIAVSTAGALLSKTLHLSDDVYLAMLARGFRGEIYVLDDFRMLPRDWAALAAFAAVTTAAICAGR